VEKEKIEFVELNTRKAFGRRDDDVPKRAPLTEAEKPWLLEAEVKQGGQRGKIRKFRGTLEPDAQQSSMYFCCKKRGKTVLVYPIREYYRMSLLPEGVIEDEKVTQKIEKNFTSSGTTSGVATLPRFFYRDRKLQEGAENSQDLDVKAIRNKMSAAASDYREKMKNALQDWGDNYEQEVPSSSSGGYEELKRMEQKIEKSGGDDAGSEDGSDAGPDDGYEEFTNPHDDDTGMADVEDIKMDMEDVDDVIDSDPDDSLDNTDDEDETGEPMATPREPTSRTHKKTGEAAIKEAESTGILTPEAIIAFLQEKSKITPWITTKSVKKRFRVLLADKNDEKGNVNKHGANYQSYTETLKKHCEIKKDIEHGQMVKLRKTPIMHR